MRYESECKNFAQRKFIKIILYHVTILPWGQKGKGICYGKSEDWVKFMDKLNEKNRIINISSA